MDFDDLQKAWRNQPGARPLTIDPVLLFREVRRNHRQFLATIFWRDARELAVGLLLIAYFSWHGWRHHAWTDFGIVAGCLFVCGYFVLDRLIQWRRRPKMENSLIGCVETSLVQVRHQIWLLRNIFWWYQLPLIVPLLISFGWTGWRTHHLGALIVGIVLLWLINRWIYRLNQKAVSAVLEPRRQELEALRKALQS